MHTYWEHSMNNNEVITGTLNLINATVTDNILRQGGWINVRNSIINSFGGTEVNSQGYNLIVYPQGTTITGDTTGNILGVNPRLGPLGYYGGSTMTRPLLPVSRRSMPATRRPRPPPTSAALRESARRTSARSS